MHLVKLGKQLASSITAVTLLAGAAGARADGPHPRASGGASLTGLTPSVRVPVRVRSLRSLRSRRVDADGPARVSPCPLRRYRRYPPAPAIARARRRRATAPTPPAAPVCPRRDADNAVRRRPFRDAWDGPRRHRYHPDQGRYHRRDPAPPADPDPPAASEPAPTPPASPPPAASNTTTQTITQVQVSTCVSHCAGGTQVQQASQDNTTVQAVGPPVPSDGGSGRRRAARAPPQLDRERRRFGRRPRRHERRRLHAQPAPQPGVTQVQVGCVAHCYGTTTLDHVGSHPGADRAAPGRAPRAHTADGGRSAGRRSERHPADRRAVAERRRAASPRPPTQLNGTAQVVVTLGRGTGRRRDPARARRPSTRRPRAIVQLQVGCIFYCSGTQQTQAGPAVQRDRAGGGQRRRGGREHGVAGRLAGAGRVRGLVL